MESNPKILVIVPCYKRPEYTAKCIKALEEAQDYENVTFKLIDDGSKDGTAEILHASGFIHKLVIINDVNVGLRSVLIDCFNDSKEYDYILKIDNDCVVPKNWLNEIIEFLQSGWVDIVSPNIYPSNAAFKFGASENPDKPGLRPSKLVGGLWAMSTKLLDGIYFEKIDTTGIVGSFSLLNQIIVEKSPRIGWLPDIVVQDLGHWSGNHPEHIKSEDHLLYSLEVGRRVAWG